MPLLLGPVVVVPYVVLPVEFMLVDVLGAICCVPVLGVVVGTSIGPSFCCSAWTSVAQSARAAPAASVRLAPIPNASATFRVMHSSSLFDRRWPSRNAERSLWRPRKTAGGLKRTRSAA